MHSVKESVASDLQSYAIPALNHRPSPDICMLKLASVDHCFALADERRILAIPFAFGASILAVVKLLSFRLLCIDLSKVDVLLADLSHIETCVQGARIGGVLGTFIAEFLNP